MGSNAPDSSDRAASQRRRLEERAVEQVAAAFRKDGWSVSLRPKHPAADLLCRKDALVYAVEIKAWSGRVRREFLRSMLAESILRGSVQAERSGARLLVILVAPSLSEGIVGELREYVHEFGGGAAWGILDDRGRFLLEGPGLGSVEKEADRRLSQGPASKHRAPRREVQNPFSDLGQWMLKVLLAPRIPAHLLHAPRSEARGIVDLAELAQVSPTSASKFLGALEQDGFVMESKNAIRLARLPALLEAWRLGSQRPAEERLARSIMPSSDPLVRLRSVLKARGRAQIAAGNPAAGARGARVCLALFSACDELGLGFVRGAPRHIYSEDLSDEFLANLELHPVEHRAEADVIVRRPKYLESVFRGSVEVGGVAVADALQCWLDVGSHPARGAEQAAEIERHLKLWETTA